MQRVKATHNFQNKREVPALHESCVQNVKKQPTIALQIFWVKCFSLNYSAQSAQKCMAVNAFGYNERWRYSNVGKTTKHKEAAAFQDKMKPLPARKLCSERKMLSMTTRSIKWTDNLLLVEQKATRCNGSD